MESKKKVNGKKKRNPEPLKQKKTKKLKFFFLNQTDFIGPLLFNGHKVNKNSNIVPSQTLCDFGLRIQMKNMINYNKINVSMKKISVDVK